MRQVIVYGIIRENKDRVVPASRQVGSRCLHFNMDKKTNVLLCMKTYKEKQAKEWEKAEENKLGNEANRINYKI